MNFDFDEDQRAIQEQARTVLSKECPAERVRTAMESDTPFDEALWKQIVELGWPATAIQEEHGGLGLGYLELCLIGQELGRCLAPTPFIASVYMAAEAVKMAGSEEQKAEYLEKIGSGEVIGTLAHKGNCTVDGDTLTGRFSAVPHGTCATHAVVAVGDDFYWLDLSDDGVTKSAQTSVDPTIPLAALELKNASAVRLSRGGKLSDLLDRIAVLLSFEQIGGCEAAIDMGKAYTQGRYAFGRQVASFQAIKHKFADMYVAMELARSNAWYGAWALSVDSEELPLAAATARVSAVDAYYECSKENIQAHGGMGFTWEFDCHLYYRRAQALSLIIGGSSKWKEHLTTRLLAA